MIIDILANSATYANLHPDIKTALEFISAPGTATLPPGRYPINGDDIFAIIETCQGNGKEHARLEIHKRYLDVQLVVSGDEWMGWSPFATCSLDREGFSATNDIGFCNEKPDAWFQVQPGCFTIFYPSDAHAPLCGTGKVHKVIVKVAVD